MFRADKCGICIHTYIHTQTHTHTHTTHAQTGPCTCTCIHTCTHTNTHTIHIKHTEDAVKYARAAASSLITLLEHWEAEGGVPAGGEEARNRGDGHINRVQMDDTRAVKGALKSLYATVA
jgi:hypothetical protein